MFRIRAITLGMLAIFAIVLVPTEPAFAHDQLIWSDPQPGQRLETAPESVSLEFSNDLLVLSGVGALVMVVDADNRDWVIHTPRVSGRTVSAELAKDMPVAGYEVRWQVVSADGHPISGMIPFTIGAAEPLSQVAGGAGETGAAAARSEAEHRTQTTVRVALSAAVCIIAMTVAFTIITQIRRRRDRSAASPR